MAETANLKKLLKDDVFSFEITLSLMYPIKQNIIREIRIHVISLFTTNARTPAD